MLKLNIRTFKVSILFHQCGAGKEPIPKQPNAARDKNYRKHYAKAEGDGRNHATQPHHDLLQLDSVVKSQYEFQM